MIVQSIDGDSLVLTKTELSEQGQNSDFTPRIKRGFTYLTPLKGGKRC